MLFPDLMPPTTTAKEPFAVVIGMTKVGEEKFIEWRLSVMESPPSEGKGKQIWKKREKDERNHSND